MLPLTTPLNWQRVRLGDVGKPCMCKRVMKHQTTRYGEIPFYKIGTFGNTADAFISKKLFLEYKTKYSFPKKGDILISASGTIGRAVIYDGKPAYFQDSNIVWIDNDETLVKNDFLFYVYSNVKWNTEHTTILRLYNDNFRNTLIPLPPLNEQIAIANILSDVDRYLYSLDALILKKESVKKALSFELLSQRKRLKGFNQAWQRVRLGDIAEIKRGVRITKNELDVFGKYPVVSGGVGFLGYTNNFNRYENTITIAQYGTAGYVNFQKNKFWANDVCFCVYPSKNVIKNIFLYYFLKVNQNYLYEISNRNATPYSISKDKILDFEIPLPPLDEQIAIANILSALDHKIISLKNKKRQFENIKKALNRDLMSAKIRVLKK
ncbi:restriction endonuclease subunit S [Helicobacter pylori]|uniref:Restriction endonuclease subunit S n=1 Tax=Helicobacter pylori TaxID=210 RepID=A0AAE7ARX1_HELPX|nr:restriction endonuclease subunit S [Helicobacter pylori]QJW30015.1 restriction endonuclease subunit S [Helicobacter pylori A45]QJW41304.1 restriction endonuclease subunit S [Helicobacter pylori]QJW42765.1 restriction endonuclease subunit S [Helicobacter pylori]QJW44223.1 restriction endonuclease subunit S [Helicobacter pylori]